MKILRLIFSKLVRKIYVIRGIKIRITGSFPALTSAYKFGTIGTALLLKQQRFMRPFIKPVKRGAQNLPPRPTQENDSSPQKSKCEPPAGGSYDLIGKMVGDPGIPFAPLTAYFVDRMVPQFFTAGPLTNSWLRGL